jgi:hypothetical protein
MNSLKKLFLLLFLLFISGLPYRLGLIDQSGNELITIFFSVTGMLSFTLYLSKYRYKVDQLDIYILIFLIVYPLFSSIVARITVGQPIYFGLLTFRGLFVLFTYYTFLLIGYSDTSILKNTRNMVIFIMLFVAILFFLFGLNDFNVLFRKGTLAIKYGLTTTKGMQFSGYTCLLFIPYVAGWVNYFEKNKSGYLVLPMVILLFSVLVPKARNEILTMMTLPLFMYYIKYKLYDVKFLFYTLVLASVLFIVLSTENVVSKNFYGLTKPTDLEFAQKTGDYSAYLRVEEYVAGWKSFMKYPVTGIGSISYRFHGGYMGFISDWFFISDIGIMGILVKGGLILLSIYIFLYARLLKYFSGDNLISITGRYMIYFLIIELIIGNDYIVNFTGVIVILFLLKPPRADIKRNVESKTG